MAEWVTARHGWATGSGAPWRIRCALLAAFVVFGWSLAAAPAQAVDPTDSILTYDCNSPLPRSAANCGIWHTNPPVSLLWTLPDPAFTPVAGSNCGETILTDDTLGTDVTCAVENLALAQQVQKTVTLRVDQTPPDVTGSTPARPADHAGWWNHQVDWTFAGSDLTSGLAGCDTVTYSGPNSATGDVAGVCRDIAGNSTTGHAAIKYDAAGPNVSSITPQRVADRAGWWNHPVAWSLQATDAPSGLAGCDSPTYSGPNTSTGTVSGACRDNAGNSTTKQAPIKYDDAAPDVTGATPARAADGVDWWNHPITWTFQGTDAPSGIASCDSVTYSGPDTATGVLSGACRDNAGNSASTRTAFKYDGTAPNVTSSTPERPADNLGWWNHPVKWAFAGNDALSGIASCDTVTYTGPDSATGDVKGDCRDLAANATTGHAPIKYDASPPAISAITPQRVADRNGWWNHPVAWTLQATDAPSGLVGCANPTYSGPNTGTGTVSGACSDFAGNSATKQAAIKYDDVAPSVTGATPARVADTSAGWWNHAVSWTFQGTDATSGVAGCDTVTYAGPDDPAGAVSGSCSDIAGNAAGGSSPIKFDATKPTLTGATPARVPDGGTWWNHPIKINFGGADATSGIAACDAVTYSGPDATAASVNGSCTDNAGNVTAGASSVKYDATAPTITSITAKRGPDQAGWWNHPVDVVFTGTDGLSGLAGCDTITYSGPDSPTADVAGACRDVAGNSATGHLAIKYDGQPPTLTALLPEVGNNEAILHWFASADAVKTEITRSPGIGTAALSTVYSGSGDSAFSDPGVKNDVTYTYSISATDVAGNKASVPVSVTPRAFSAPPPGVTPPPTTAPVASAAPAPAPQHEALPVVEPPRIAAITPVEAPRLQWRRVKTADYYNVQLYRGKKKILTKWPKSAHLQLRKDWRYHGRLERLTAGSYHWYAWPGFGSRSEHRYGKLIAHDKFTFSLGATAALFPR